MCNHGYRLRLGISLIVFVLWAGYAAVGLAQVGKEDEDLGEDIEKKPGHLVVLFLFTSMLFGSIIRHLLLVHKSVTVPYTVLLLLVGIAWGLMRSGLSDLGESVEIISSIQPDLLLEVFLPALIFESTFSTNFHIIWREFGQALLLAGPGVVIATGLTGSFIRFAFSWDWYISLMFGAMISATDPVAVVALLREVGASQRLATLIEAESLLNDGTAFVLYVILQEAVVSNHISTGSALVTFFRLSFGGAALGITAGAITVLWLNHVFNDALIETSMTIFMAYLTFWFAELHFIEVSGVLSVVFLGLYISRNKASVSPNVEESVHHVWEMISFIANTIIFLLSGVLVAIHIGGDFFNLSDLLRLLELYIVLHVVRFLVVLILFPLLRHQGYSLNWKDGLVLVYGGLRGAIALALALLTNLETKIDEEIRQKIMFHSSGIVLLTLLINATTIRWLLITLGLNVANAESAHVFNRTLKHLKNEENVLKRTLKHDRHYAGADWKHIRKLLPRLDDLMKHGDMTTRNSILSSTTQFSVFSKGDDVEEQAVPVLIDQDKLEELANVEAKRRQIVIDVRLRFISATKAAYWRQFEEGLTSKRAVQALVETAERAMDCGSLAEQWHAIEPEFHVPKWLSKLYMSKLAPFLSRRLLFQRLAFAVELATAFVEATQRIEHAVMNFPEFGDVEACAMVSKELKVYQHLAEEASIDVQKSYPEVYQAIRTRHVAELLLHRHIISVTTLFRQGILISKEYDEFVQLIEGYMHTLRRTPLTEGLSSVESILTELSFIVHLSDSERNQLLNSSEKLLLSRGDYIYRHGEKSHGIYVVARGLVDVCIEGHAVETLGIGSVIGAWSLLSGEKFFADMQAHSLVEAFYLDREIVETLLKNHKVQETLWKMAGSTLLKAYFSDSFPGFSRVALGVLCSESTLVRPTPLKEHVIKRTSMLVNGRVMFSEEMEANLPSLRRSEGAPVILMSAPDKLKFSEDSILLEFSTLDHQVVLNGPRMRKRKLIDTYLSQYHSPKLEKLRRPSVSRDSLSKPEPVVDGISHPGRRSVVVPAKLDRLRRAAHQLVNTAAVSKSISPLSMVELASGQIDNPIIGVPHFSSAADEAAAAAAAPREEPQSLQWELRDSLQQQQKQPDSVGSGFDRRAERGYEVPSISIPSMRTIPPDKTLSINFRLGVERGYSTGGTSDPYSPIIEDNPENIPHEPTNDNGTSPDVSPAVATVPDPSIHLSPANEEDSKSNQSEK